MAPTCPACDAAEVAAAPEWPLHKKTAFRCKGCDLLFSWPQPAPGALDEFYGPTGGWRTSHEARGKPLVRAKGKGKAGRALIARLDALLPESSRRVLDFGCGEGPWLNAFADAGWETWGIEPATDVAFTRHRRLTTIPADRTFDCVIAYHVLEHLPRPFDTLCQFHSALQPGGVCVVSVPRVDTLDIHQDRHYCLNERYHLVAFSERCLRGLLLRAGFRAVQDAHDLDPLFTKGQPIRMRLIAMA